MKKGLAFRDQKREKAEKLKVKKKQGRKFREFFFFFIFCLRETEREHCKLSEVFLRVKKGERVSREKKLSLKVCFHH